MLKVLLLNRWRATASAYTINRKTGKKRGIGGIIGYIILFLYCFGFFGWAAYRLGKALAGVFTELEMTWAYWSMMNIAAFSVGVIGSVFTTYSALYKSKDNDLLLSLPIKSRTILLSRLIPCILYALLFVAMVFIPAQLAYFTTAGFNFAVFLTSFFYLLCLPVLCQALACVLAWIIAFVSSKLPANTKSLSTVVLALVFFGAYYVVCFRATNIVSSLIANAALYGQKMEGGIMYYIGLGADGNFALTLAIVALTAVALCLVIAAQSRSFINFSTTKKGNKKKAQVKYESRGSSAVFALVKKEKARFFSMPGYILNCGLGLVFMLAAAVILLIKASAVRDLFGSIGEQFLSYAALLVCGLMLFLQSMIDISAPSISLEGNSLWLLQSMPLRPAQVLNAKFLFHFLVGIVPTLLLSAIACVVFGFGTADSILTILFSVGALVFTDVHGLAIGLRMPNLKWTNEMVVIKQGLGVTLALFSPWIVAGAFVGLFFLFGKNLAPTVFLTILSAVLWFCNILIYSLMQKHGKKVLSFLN